MCRNCRGPVDPEVFSILAREEHYAPSARVLGEEVRKRTESAVVNKTSGALASLILEAGIAWDDVDPITPQASVAIARYLLGVPSSGA